MPFSPTLHANYKPTTTTRRAPVQPFFNVLATIQALEGLGRWWWYNQGREVCHVCPPESQPPVGVDVGQGLKQRCEGNTLLASLSVKFDKQHLISALRGFLLVLLLLCQQIFQSRK